MNYEIMRREILQLLLESKKKNGQGMLTSDTIAERLGTGIADDEVQYCLVRLGADGLVHPLPGNDRILAVALTIDGEAAARGD